MIEFENMPEVSDKAIEYMASKLTPYLFFETIEKGVREYTCTKCRNTFKVGEKVSKRIIFPEERALYHAKHRSEEICPHCKTKATVINIKRKTTECFNEDKNFCILSANSPNDIWIRCLDCYVNYRYSLKGVIETKEYMRYHLTPGEAVHWRRGYYEAWHRENKPYEAFCWNHGYYAEKYDYECIYDNGTEMDNTFLKYNSFGYYANRYFYGKMPYIKYLCWYAVHPQIEMLAKLGHYETIDEMTNHNTDSKSILDWSAKTPWGLYRLPKQIYDYWSEDFNHSIRLLKIYHAMKGKSIEDFKTAHTLYSLKNQELGPTKKLISRLKKVKTSPKALIKYCKKISKDSVGCCHQCPGITTAEAFGMWQDYIDMALRFGVDNFQVYPPNLKAAHDRLVSIQTAVEIEEEAKRYKNIAYKYKKIHIRNLKQYEFKSDEFIISVPKEAKEIIKEGKRMKHCVGGYTERHLKGTLTILFLRKADAPDISLYTIEMHGTALTQVQGYNNRTPLTKEAKVFFDNWLKWVQAGSHRDKNGTPILEKEILTKTA